MLAILLRVTLIFSTLANCGHFQNNHESQVRILEKIAELDEKIQVQGDMIIKQDEKIQILQTVIMPKKNRTFDLLSPVEYGRSSRGK